jgi:hypothetical protein
MYTSSFDLSCEFLKVGFLIIQGVYHTRSKEVRPLRTRLPFFAVLAYGTLNNLGKVQFNFSKLRVCNVIELGYNYDFLYIIYCLISWTWNEYFVVSVSSQKMELVLIHLIVCIATCRFYDLTNRTLSPSIQLDSL